MREWFSIIGWNFGLIRSVFQKLLKVQVGSVIYTQPLLYAKWKTKQALRGLCLIHDNAPAHKCVLVQDFFLKEEKVVQLSHPPYSPDLSPCDFFLFLLLKKTLSVCRYESWSALGSAIYQCLQGIPKKAYFLPLPNGFRDLKSRGWSGGAKVLCILHHRGVQLILAYNWARPAILVVGNGRGGMFLFLLFLHFLSCSLSSLSLSFISSTLFSISFLPFSGRRHKMTLKGWRVVKPQHNQHKTWKVYFRQGRILRRVEVNKMWIGLITCPVKPQWQH